MKAFFYAHRFRDESTWLCGYWPWLYVVVECEKPLWRWPRFHIAKSKPDDIQPPVYYVRFGWLLVAVAIGVRNGKEVLRKGLAV